MPHLAAARCYTLAMPTSLPRTTITRTHEVERLLSVARARWPDESPAAQLVHLAEVGARALGQDERQVRRARLERTAQVAADRYGRQFEDGYLETLRSEW